MPLFYSIFNQIATYATGLLNMMSQFWGSRGLPCIQPNIPGSSGFGADYHDASDGKWDEVVDHLKAVIDWARDRGIGSKPIITGGSWGAYAAIKALEKSFTKHVIAINGVYDLEQDLKNIETGKTKYSKDDLTDTRIQFGLSKKIRQANSVNLTASLGKVLLFAGLKDKNCLPEQSQELFKRMDALDIHAQLITMAEEGHSISDQKNRLMMLRVQEEFVGRITGVPYEPYGYSTIAQTPGAVMVETRQAMGYGSGALVIYQAQ